MYRLWQLGVFLAATCVVAAFVSFGIGAWNIDPYRGGTDARFGGLGGVLLLGSIPLWAITLGPDRPERPLPWRERRQLHRERARIRLDKAIKDLEREAGL